MTPTPKDPDAVALGRALGRLGGLQRSPAKRAAAQANGAKGGRPRRLARCPACAAKGRTCYHAPPPAA